MHIRNNHFPTKKYATPHSLHNPIPTTHSPAWAIASTIPKIPIIIPPLIRRCRIIKWTTSKWIIIQMQFGMAPQMPTMRISNSSIWTLMLPSYNLQPSTSSKTSILTLNFSHLASPWRWVTINIVSLTTCSSSSKSRCGQTKHRSPQCSGSRGAWQCYRDSNGFINDSRFCEESTSISAKKCRKWTQKKNGIISNNIMTSSTKSSS